MTSLHDDAFHDAAAAFMRGFDQATFATDTPEPENPVGMRSLLLERLRQSRSARRLAHDHSFSAETHLGDALNALFYQPARWMHYGRAQVPEGWTGLLQTMPILAPLVSSGAPIGLPGRCVSNGDGSLPPRGTFTVHDGSLTAWCNEYAAGDNFWHEHHIGHRICEWIDRTLGDESPGASDTLTRVREELGRGLDVLVRSGITSARALEARIADNGELKKTA